MSGEEPSYYHLNNSEMDFYCFNISTATYSLEKMGGIGNQTCGHILRVLLTRTADGAEFINWVRSFIADLLYMGDPSK